MTPPATASTAAPQRPRPPFLIVPWRRDFLAGVLDCLLDAQPEACRAGDLSRCTIVFPHRRPRRYLQKMLAADPRLPKPCRPPVMISSAEFVTRLRAALVTQELAPLATSIGRLDQVALLHECLLEAQRQSSGALSSLSLRETHVFFPWGLRLAGLLEECLQHAATPQNLLYQDQAPPFAAALLEELATIHEIYVQKLDAGGWTTAGRDAALVAAQPEAAARAVEGVSVFLAGFSLLSGAQDALYRALWENGGLQVLLHADPQLARGSSSHWSCAELRRWMRRWSAAAELLDNGPELGANERPGPQIALYEGFDLHSQLDALGRRLTEQAAKRGLEDTAVVLPATDLLLPALHHLPHELARDGVNVSMGYPLNRSSLAQLVETLLRLQENAPQRGLYHWRDCVDLIRLPYLKMLAPYEGQTLRFVLHELENHCRKAGKHLDPRQWTPEDTDLAQRLGAATPEDLARILDLLAAILERCLTAWEELPDLASLAAALEAVCELLVSYGKALWPRFPLDAECLHRLLYSVIPALRQSRLSREPFPRDALFAIVRGLLEEERAPFEAEPLSGLQLLGMLETRLLRFDTLYILDATDANLPGGAQRDPLLPDSLRPALGLPDERVRERLAAYNFHRLINGAREVVLLYQASTQGVGLLEQKSVRSRFVEELIWEEEKRRGALIQPGDPLIHVVTYPIKPISRCCRVIRKTASVRAQLDTRLRSALSPSALDCYLHCPARFFYQHVAGLTPLDAFVEEGDPAAIGTLLHAILKEYFSPYINRLIQPENLDKNALQDLFSTRLAESELFGQLPFDQRLLLEKTGRYRLGRLLAAMPPTTIIGLEEPCEARVAVTMDDANRAASPDALPDVLINGRLDRIDLRQDGPRILDYKTGGMKNPASGFWQDNALWSDICDWRYFDEEAANDLLLRVAQGVNSVQLPCYLHLYRERAANGKVLQAAYVALREDGEEFALFSDKMDSAQRNDAVEHQIPELLGFLVGRLVASQTFSPRPDRQCDYCPYRHACEE